MLQVRGCGATTVSPDEKLMQDESLNDLLSPVLHIQFVVPSFFISFTCYLFIRISIFCTTPLYFFYINYLSNVQNFMCYAYFFTFFCSKTSSI